MKKAWQSLQRGDFVEAKVAELLLDQFIIANWQGSLLRVKNQSGQVYQVGDILRLRVDSVNPLLFRIGGRQEYGLNRIV